MNFHVYHISNEGHLINELPRIILFRKPIKTDNRCRVYWPCGSTYAVYMGYFTSQEVLKKVEDYVVVTAVPDTYEIADYLDTEPENILLVLSCTSMYEDWYDKEKKNLEQVLEHICDRELVRIHEYEFDNRSMRTDWQMDRENDYGF